MKIVQRRPSGIILPDSEGRLVVRRLELRFGHFTEFGKEWMRERRPWCSMDEGVGFPAIAGGSGFSQYAEQKAVNHANGQATWSAVGGSYLALCTSIPTSSSTGSTIVEATYTGYARASVVGNWTAATVATPSVGVNTATITFAACTGSTSTLNAFALCDASTVGNVIWWGTLSMTVISVTQTPATVAAGVLQTSLT
jgi:hypothetical protein